MSAPLIHAIRTAAITFRVLGLSPPKIELDAIAGWHLSVELAASDIDPTVVESLKLHPGCVEIYGIEVTWPAQRDSLAAAAKQADDLAALTIIKPTFAATLSPSQQIGYRSKGQTVELPPKKGETT